MLAFGTQSARGRALGAPAETGRPRQDLACPATGPGLPTSSECCTARWLDRPYPHANLCGARGGALGGTLGGTLGGLRRP